MTIGGCSTKQTVYHTWCMEHRTPEYPTSNVGETGDQDEVRVLNAIDGLTHESTRVPNKG
jgi:hypothetical protein